MTMTLRNMLVDDFFQRILVGEADHLLDDLASLEQEQRRNAADAELEGRVRVLVHVQLADDDPAVVIARQLLHRRRQAAAGTAPFRPEINEYGLFAGDRLIEIAVGECLYLVGCHQSPLEYPVPYTL